MTRREQLQEQYEEAYFALLMDDLAAEEGERAKAEHEALLSDPGSAVPEDVRLRCLKSIKRSFASRRAGRAARFTGKLFRRIAAVSVIALVLCAAVLASSETARAAALKFAVSAFSDRTEITLSETEDLPDSGGLCPDLEVGWTPGGFAPADSGVSRAASWRTFEDRDGHVLHIALIRLGAAGVMSVDSEDCETEHIQINGQPAELMTKNTEQEAYRQIVLPLEDLDAVLYMACFCDEVSDEELMKTAANVGFFPR